MNYHFAFPEKCVFWLLSADCKIKTNSGIAGEMAQWATCFRALAALVEDLDMISSTLRMAHNCNSSSREAGALFRPLQGSACGRYT